MKKILVTLAAAFASFSASAAPAIALPPGPIYLEYTGQEQIAINGAHTYTDGKEINWGVFVVTSLSAGDVTAPHDLIDKDQSVGAFFSNVTSGGQITGMFYGIEQGGASAGNAFPATGGYLDLYWRDTPKLTPSKTTSGITPSIRCGYDCATGFTDGVLLAHLYFDTGMDAFSNKNTIVGSQAPTTNKAFSGSATSYASVSTSKKGLWSYDLNANWFMTDEGNRDLRFENTYKTNTNWNGKAGSNILGAQISAGSGQAYALPEPGVLSLMGLALIGMGVALRRRRG